ncbi:MAG: LytR C-terminal domain-containing protein [Deltaproteobacteria bacterium]|nr:LytR C-terminal domain-containing protein [Deltaproteobacteria bacterium]
MLKHYLFITICLVLSLQSCSTSKPFEGNSQEEANLSKTTPGQDRTETVANKMEIEYLQQQIDRLQEENNRIRDENKTAIAQIKAQNETLEEEIERLKKEKININKEENIAISNKVDINGKSTVSSSDLSKLSKNTQKVSIKVLAGDGSLVSARNMSKELADLGYKIDSIGSAPRSDFQTTTVYFEPLFQNEAKALALRLGTNIIIKPLTWPSIFDIIVVTGKHP